MQILAGFLSNFGVAELIRVVDGGDSSMHPETVLNVEERRGAAYVSEQGQVCGMEQLTGWFACDGLFET